MRRIGCLLFMCLACFAQNLLHNSAFEGTEDNLGIWSYNFIPGEQTVTLLKGEGVDGKNALRIDFTKQSQLKQHDIHLVEGEKYKIGAWVRTKNLKSRNRLLSILVYDYGWYHEAATKRLPENTDGKWVLLESEFKAFGSSNNLYSFTIYGFEATGEFDVCEPFVIPLSEKAIAESKPAPIWQKQMEFVYPYYPVMSEVDADTGEVRFATSFHIEGKGSDYDCVAAYSGNSASLKKTVPFSDHKLATVTFGQLPLGEGRVSVKMVHRADGKTILENEYSMTAIRRPTVKYKQLNNFVQELYRGPLENREYSFMAPKDGWYRIAFSVAQRNAVATLDNAADPVVLWREGEESQTMRLLKMGQHTVRVSNAIKGAEIVISKVPQLLIFPFTVAEQSYFSPEAKAANAFVCPRFDYDREYTRKKIWPAYNSYIMTYDWKPKTDIQKWADNEFKQRGFQILGSGGFDKKGWLDENLMYNNIINSSPVKTTSGRCLDETGPQYSRGILVALSKLGWKLQTFDKDIHTWMAVGNSSFFGSPEIHRPALASCINMSQGRGKVLLEFYPCSTKNQSELDKYMANFPKQMTIARKVLPDIQEHCIYFVSGYLTAGAWNCNAHPETDIKYILDAFFHTMANHPDCINPAGLGCYDIKYSDEENIRWITKLIHHYCIEGRRDMLSEKYGFVLNPNHIQNCDFENGLEGWDAQPAEKDSILPKNYKGLGRSYQHRRSPYNTTSGDTCLQFTRSDKAPNRVSQNITGLIKGKLYSLMFVTADPEDIVKAKNQRAQFALRSDIENATSIPELGYDFRLPRGWDGSWGQGKDRREIHTRKVVFRANSTEAKLTFSDWETDAQPGAAIGQKRIINFVCVRPYYEDK